MSAELTSNPAPPQSADPPAEPRPPKSRTQRWLYLGFGWLCLGLALVGIPLPLVPTTPFLLLAAFGFARGSDRSYRWLLDHPRFGPPVRDWRRYRAVSLKAKLLATVSIAIILGLSLWMQVALWVLIVQATVLAGVALFVWTRPLPPAPSH